MENWAAAFDSAQQQPSPPQSPEEESMLKNQWMEYFAKPEISQGLMQMGAALLQPYQPGETGSGRFGAALTQGAQTIGNAAKQNFAMDEAADEKQYKRGRDVKSDERAAADDKRQNATLGLAQQKFKYEQGQDAQNRQDTLNLAAQNAEMDRLKIASGVYESIAKNVEPGTPQEEINRLAMEVFKQMQSTTGAQNAIINNAGGQSAGSDMGVSQPDTTQPAQEPAGGQPSAGPEVNANPTVDTQNVESFIADMKKNNIREKIQQQYGAGAAAVINDEIGKFPKEVRQRMLDYFVKGI